jgi:hypothetical protein
MEMTLNIRELKMNFSEAAKKGISKLRLPEWRKNKFAYVELHLIDKNMYGPWATVHDVNFEKQLFVGDIDCNNYEEYKDGDDFKHGKMKDE